jgi:glycosyltransferase involved in cell wall biosynthesis
MKTKVTHIISGLQIGGAEMMLCRLLSAIDPSRFESQVIALGPRGPLAERIEAMGIPLICMGLRGPKDFPVGLWKLTRLLKQQPPDVIHTWLYHADLLGSLAAKFSGHSIPVTWGVHHSHSGGGMKRTTKAIVWLLARLSKWLPSKIICCSQASILEHSKLGYDASKMELIFNGADVDVFKPNSAARIALRQQLSIPQDAPVVGYVGRNMPVKDLPTFLAAAEIVRQQRPEAHFVLCGPDLPNAEHVHVLPFHKTVQDVYPAFDILALTSLSEACPMCLIEAMACGVPCASTDVGDATHLINNPATISPAGQPASIAASWLQLLALSKTDSTALSASGRQRISDFFSLDICITKHQALYLQLSQKPVLALLAPKNISL